MEGNGGVSAGPTAKIMISVAARHIHDPTCCCCQREHVAGVGGVAAREMLPKHVASVA